MKIFRHASVYLMFISGISPLHSIFSGFEHFPWGLVCLMMFGRVNLAAMMIALYMSSYLLLGSFDFSSRDSSLSISMLPMALNLISPLFFFRGNEELLAKVARNVFWLYLFIGVLQFFSILVPFEFLIDPLISRFHGGPIGSGYRGVQMLETEPARASYQLLALYLFSQIIGTGNRSVMTLALVFGQVVLISSTTGLILTGLYLMWKSIFEIVRRPYLILVAIGSLLLLLPAIQNNPKTAIVIELYQSEGISGAFTALAATSGGRFLGSVNAVDSIIDRPFGGGADPKIFAGHKVVEEDQLVPGYLLRSSARPVSGALTVLIMFGLPFAFLVAWSIRSIIGPYRLSAAVVFAVILSVVYSPPFGEMSLLVILAAVYAQARSRDAAVEPFSNYGLGRTSSSTLNESPPPSASLKSFSGVATS